MRAHEYFTEQARSLRDAGKQENIASIEQMLRDEVGDDIELDTRCPPPVSMSDNQ